MCSLFQNLRPNNEFLVLFADRVQKHMFNGGALSESESIARFLGLCGEIDMAIAAESARWGDVQASTPYGNTAGSSTDIDADYYPPTLNNPIYFTREQHWLVERDNVTGHYIPTLHDTSDSRSIIRELRSNSLFPSIDAPVFAQHGGIVPTNHSLVISAGAGDVHYTLDGSDPREVGGTTGVTSIMIPSGGSVILTQTGTVKARALHGGEWSALTEAEFIVGQAASPASLAVTEIHYNPYGTSEDTEFIELMNIDPAHTIDLSDVTFTGITYTFPFGTTLGPLARIVIVRDQAAYDTAGMRIAPGEFTPSALSNSGEELAVIAQDGITDIRRFTYSDLPAWPTSPDGEGYSLVLIAPENDPAHGDPFSWRASTGPGGNPGTSDAAPAFTGDPNIDADHDGRSAFLEHALGTSDMTPDADAALTLGSDFFDDGTGTIDAYPTITYQRNLAADDVIHQVQTSTTMAPGSWQGGPGFTTLVSSVNNGDGTATVTHRSNNPLASMTREFLRLQVTSTGP